MKRTRSLQLAGLALGLMMTGAVQASLGSWTEEKAMGLEQRMAGLESRRVTVGDHELQIFTRNLGSEQPCTVMVHGFTARAAHWFRMARRLPEKHCVIAIDLPGFGDSSFLPTASYKPEVQADRLSTLLKALPLATSQVDMIGNSMGGYIAAEFALRHPEQTHSITLVDAAGVTQPNPSPLFREIEAGHNPFFATDVPAYRQFYTMTMSEPPYVPGFVLDAIAEEAISRNTRYQYIFEQINRRRIDDQIAQIKVPTLIVWGDQDKL
ncbi:MAG: alpha/beta hydrolase, partial [Perlucidibaca sp.]